MTWRSELDGVERDTWVDDVVVTLERRAVPDRRGVVWTRAGENWRRVAPYPRSWPTPGQGDLFGNFTDADRPFLRVVMEFPVDVEPDPFPQRFHLFRSAA